MLDCRARNWRAYDRANRVVTRSLPIFLARPSPRPPAPAHRAADLVAENMADKRVAFNSRLKYKQIAIDHNRASRRYHS